MRIVHILFGGAFNEDMAYQGNILPKENKAAGHNVTIIAGCYKWSKSDIVKVPEEDRITNEGIRLIRLKFDKIITEFISKKVKKARRLKEVLNEIKPDIIFHHDVQAYELLTVAQYKKKHQDIKLYVDNHSDLMNSGRNWLSINILHKMIWKNFAKLVEPYVDKFYGVLPARVDFLVDVYKINKKKVELLVMGAEDDKVIEALSCELINTIRKENGVNNNEFLIMTGGKIDSNKAQVLLLMKAIADIGNPKVKLVIFGSVSPKYKEEFLNLLNDNIKYIGWINAKDTYKYFSAADLVVFPGLHSVFWEQVVGLGKPCVFKFIKGFTHINIGGNCKFFYEDSVKEIKNVLSEIIDNTELYKHMKSEAVCKGMDIFSYKKIAEKSISN